MNQLAVDTINSQNNHWLQPNTTTIFIFMSQSLRIQLQDADSGTNLGYLITSIKIESCINKDMIVKLGCKLKGDFFEEEARLDTIEDVILSIDGGFGSPSFYMTVYKYSIKMVPGNDIFDIDFTLVDRYNRFREIEHKGVFYYSTIKDMFDDMNTHGFRQIFDSNIEIETLFDASDLDKYPRHPMYMHYNETNWDFLRRALLEHGLNYTWLVGEEGFKLIISPDNKTLTEYIADNISNDSIYNYSLNLTPIAENKNDNLIKFTAHAYRSGHFSNNNIQNLRDHLVDGKQFDNLTNPLINPHIFVRDVKYIHHPAYDPEIFLQSSYNFAEERHNIKRELKTRFNEVNQAQLDECVNREVAILESDKAEQVVASINGIFLLAGANLNLTNKPEIIKQDEHLVTSSIVELKAPDNVDVTKSSVYPKLEYSVVSTVISQDKNIDYHPGMPKAPQIGSLSAVFPYVSEYDGDLDIITPDAIGNVRLIFPVDYEVCPDNKQDRRYYVPRIMNSNFESAPYYPETELLVMFIDGNPNKPLIYGALAHGGTSDLNMKDHPSRHYHSYGQGSSFGYTSDGSNPDVMGNSIMFQSRHGDGVSWIAQNNQLGSEDGELALDKLVATSATRTNLIDGEYHENLGYTDKIPNHQKKVIPVRDIEDEKIVKTEDVRHKPVVQNAFSTSKSCVLVHVNVSCEHNRTIDLNENNVLEVVADKANKDTISLDYNLSCNKCCPKAGITVVGPDPLNGAIKKTDYIGQTKVDFKVGSISYSTDNAVCDAILGDSIETDSQLMFWLTAINILRQVVSKDFTANKDVYDVSFRNCATNLANAKIYAYPNIGVTGSLTLEYKSNNNSAEAKSYDNSIANTKGATDKNATATEVMPKATGDFVVNSDVVLNYANHETKLTIVDAKLSELRDKIFGSFISGVSKVLGVIDYMNRNFTDNVGKTAGMFDIDVKYPKLVVDFKGLKRVEKPNNKVGFEYADINIKFEPLLNITGTVDLFPLLLNAALGGMPKLASHLISMRNKLVGVTKKTGFFRKKVITLSGEIYLKCTMKGRLDTDINLSLLDDKTKNTGELANKLDFIIEGKIEANGKVWIIKASAGAKIGAKTGFGLSVKMHQSSNQVDWGFMFNGLVIYWSIYWDVAIDNKDINDDDDIGDDAPTEDDIAKKLIGKNIKSEHKYDNSFTLIEKIEANISSNTDSETKDVATLQQTTGLDKFIFDDKLKTIETKTQTNTAPRGMAMPVEDKPYKPHPKGTGI